MILSLLSASWFFAKDFPISWHLSLIELKQAQSKSQLFLNVQLVMQFIWRHVAIRYAGRSMPAIGMRRAITHHYYYITTFEGKLPPSVA